MHPYVRNQRNKEWYMVILASLNEHQLGHDSKGLFREPVTIEADCYFPKGLRRIDVDNVCLKPIIDGLRMANVLFNDSPQYVTAVTSRCHRTKEARPKIEIRISTEKP